MSQESSCIWAVTPELIRAIDVHLGPPVDSYVNGSQTWFTDEPTLGDKTIEWRLHPVAGFAPVDGVATDDRWETVLGALEHNPDGDALHLGSQLRALASLWDALECFVAYGDDCEPSPLAGAATARLGIAPDAAGLVDHDAIGDAWERANRTVSIAELLHEQLDGPTG